LAVAIASPALGQTVLWNFNSDPNGTLPQGWTSGWNAESPSCGQTAGNQSCDYAHLPWKVLNGTLNPPAYPFYPDHDEGENAYALTPLFQSTAASSLAHGDEGTPVLSFTVAFDPSSLGKNGQGSDSLSVFLQTLGVPAESTLLDLALGEPSDWTAADQADGLEDHIIKVTKPIAANTKYRLRIRAYDTDTQTDTFSNVGVDDIAVTNGVIVQTLTGDYNGNGKVDAADYDVWRANQGTTHALTNDPLGGTIGAAQYNQWRAHFGQSSGSGTSTFSGSNVPEPSGIASVIVSLAGLTFVRRSKTACSMIWFISSSRCSRR
jgi:hypothetical protein